MLVRMRDLPPAGWLCFSCNCLFQLSVGSSWGFVARCGGVRVFGWTDGWRLRLAGSFVLGLLSILTIPDVEVRLFLVVFG